jgi:DNA mismatch repair protein MutS2
MAVEKFLDDAALAGHREIRLVHGKGTGALRRAVEGCLRGHPLVDSFRLAEPAAGGAGATVVTLDGAAAPEGLSRHRGPRAVPGRRVSR